jgi:hypothetical protein
MKEIIRAVKLNYFINRKYITTVTHKIFPKAHWFLGMSAERPAIMNF